MNGNPVNVFHSLLEKAKEKPSGLRFGIKVLPVSSIADQYFCEKKVELKYESGKFLETEEIKVGKLGHDALLAGAVKVKAEELWGEIVSGKKVPVREFPVIAEYKGVILGGLIDAIIFTATRPILLAEYKFSKHFYPFRDHYVQARLYGFLLDLMGLDTSELKYTIIMAPPGSAGDSKLQKIPLALPYMMKLSKTVSKEGKEMDRFGLKVKGGEVKVYLGRYDRNEAEKELEWAIQFWKKERGAVPTKKEGKCRVCEFNTACLESLVKSDKLF